VPTDAAELHQDGALDCERVAPDAKDEEQRKIAAFESRIDDLHLNLNLLRYPKNLALFSLVTNGLERLYLRDVQQVPGRDRMLQTILSRSFGLFIRKVGNCPFKGHAAIKNLRADAHVRDAAAQANEYARFWFGATGYFPEWHQGECDALLTGPNSIRFGLLATKRQRAISAYQKSLLPPALTVPAQSVYAPTPEWVHAEYARALIPGTTRDGRLLYRIQKSVYEFYRDWYANKMQEAVEHPTDTDLGAYDIGDAINFWSALASFASVHDFLCYIAGQRTRLPTNSILPIRKREIWADELAGLSGLTSLKCEAILQHIICRPSSVIDLHVTPFLALDDKTAWLALAAPLAITGRFDQNLLRICSAEDPVRFNRITPDKEKRLRDDLTADTTPLRIRCLGPFSLPSPLPDVDLVLEDIEDDSIVISELKWVRQPIGWKSRRRANEELERGVKQLRAVREFLDATPGHLMNRQGGISKPISEFRNVYYSVITRGHLIDVEPTTDESMVPLDAVRHALKEERHFCAAMQWLLTDSWLPQEGIHFRIQTSHLAHQGYSIEAPVFSPA
jgi:hypothetical protein